MGMPDPQGLGQGALTLHKRPANRARLLGRPSDKADALGGLETQSMKASHEAPA